jgi:hypothetical protein
LRNHWQAKVDETSFQAPMTERPLRSRLYEESAVSDTSEIFKASTYRRDAAVCGAFAANAISPTDRELLLRLQRLLLNRALDEEWIDEPPPPPPAKSSALMRGL